MSNIEKILEVAEELKLATLRAEEIGIASYSKYYNAFHVTDEDLFRSIIKNNMPIMKNRENTEYPYQYEFTIQGTAFFTITKEPLELEGKVKGGTKCLED
jgi:hypothetical protein